MNSYFIFLTVGHCLQTRKAIRERLKVEAVSIYAAIEKAREMSAGIFWLAYETAESQANR